MKLSVNPLILLFIAIAKLWQSRDQMSVSPQALVVKDVIQVLVVIEVVVLIKLVKVDWVKKWENTLDFYMWSCCRVWS